MFPCLVVKCCVAYNASLAKQYSQTAGFIYIHCRKFHPLLLFYFHSNTNISRIFHVVSLATFSIRLRSLCIIAAN